MNQKVYDVLLKRFVYFINQIRENPSSILSDKKAKIHLALIKRGKLIGKTPSHILLDTVQLCREVLTKDHNLPGAVILKLPMTFVAHPWIKGIQDDTQDEIFAGEKKPLKEDWRHCFWMPSDFSDNRLNKDTSLHSEKIQHNVNEESVLLVYQAGSTIDFYSEVLPGHEIRVNLCRKAALFLGLRICFIKLHQLGYHHGDAWVFGIEIPLTNLEEYILRIHNNRLWPQKTTIAEYSRSLHSCWKQKVCPLCGEKLILFDKDGYGKCERQNCDISLSNKKGLCFCLYDERLARGVYEIL
jgi:hypothetical protein